MADPLPGNPNLVDVVRLWRESGGTVETYNATGELRFTHPLILRPLRINGRRKDTARAVLVSLRRLLKIRGATC